MHAVEAMYGLPSVLYTGVLQGYALFSNFSLNHRLWVHVVLTVPSIYVLDNFGKLPFYNLKNRCILHRRVHAGIIVNFVSSPEPKAHR